MFPEEAVGTPPPPLIYRGEGGPTPEPEPPEEVIHTKMLRTNRKINGQLWVAGRGTAPSDVMFIASTVHEEEAQEEQKLLWGKTLRNKAAYLKSPAGVILKDVLLSVGVDVDTCYYTALVKYLLPKEERSRPKRETIEKCIPSLDAEIREVNPKIVVAFGKAAFEALVPIKVRYPDIIGGWFFSDKYRCRVLAMPDSFILVPRPDYVDRFRIDFRELYKVMQAIKGVDVTNPVPLNYRTITNMTDLQGVVDEWRAGDFKVFSVDCEWAGRNHVNGKLKSIQFCWKAGQAIYIRFCDVKGDYVFEGGDYADAGRVLASWLNRPDVKYVGHHISADFPWMHCWLGLDYHGKALLDTEFAQQCINENGDLGLERIAMTYTDFGRYDLELYLWLKNNKQPPDAGFMHIPDEIIIPYACRDVDAPFRAYPHIVRHLALQRLLYYYTTIFNPFVTDVFTEFAVVGLPIDIELLDELREIYHYAKVRLNVKFVQRIMEEAYKMVWTRMFEVTKDVHKAREIVLLFETCRKARTPMAAWEQLKQTVGPGKLASHKALFDHFMECADFNIRSPDKMRRWLFEVKKFKPIKSTNQKEKGRPSIPWEKVEQYPDHIRKEYTPAVDKQTLQILSEQDAMVSKLLELNAVGNIAKAFLKEADLDDDGELVKENGLHYWICKDGRVHGQMSTTETGRPRSWNPNVYNWPSWVNKQITNGIGEILLEDRDNGVLPEEFEQYIYFDEEKQKWAARLPSLRSTVTAPDGWVLVESDYQTAEIRGLAFISGDPNLIKIVIEPDQDFGLVKGEKEGDKEVVRLRYSPDSGITPENQNPEYLLAKVTEGVILKRYAETDLLRDGQGNLLHPKADLHWSLAEMVHGKPREVLNEKKDRGAAKVGNFCIAEGELVLTRRGLIPIEHVLDCDLLWDGTQWVSHEGVICKGTGVVHEYQGLRATDNHEVWTETGEKIFFGQARAQRLELAKSIGPGSQATASVFRNLPQHREACFTQGLLHGADGMYLLPPDLGERSPKYGEGLHFKMPVPARFEIPKSVFAILGSSFRSYATALRKGYALFVSQLQRTWDQSAFSFAASFHYLGLGEMARCGFQENGLRPHRQRWALCPRQSAIGGSHHQFVESERHTPRAHRACEGLYGQAPGSQLHGANLFGLSPQRHDRIGIVAASSQQLKGSGQEKEGRVTRIYDIVNAGPNHRFTCSGVLVSNSSAYGASPATLERKIESDTGKKPEPGTGEKILFALQKRQPVATAHLEGREESPTSPGFIRAASGRTRHFSLHAANQKGMNSRLLRGQANAAGREARNFDMQNSVADTSANACNKLLEFARKNGLRGRPIAVLYDSVVSLVPLEERNIWAKAHSLYMFRATGWKYHNTILNYPIDTELNPSWSSKPDKKQKALLYDSDYYPTPEGLRDIEKTLDDQLELYTRNPELSVINKV